MELLDKKDKRTLRSQNYKKQQQKQKVNKVEILVKEKITESTKNEQYKYIKKVLKKTFIVGKSIVHFLASLCYLMIFIYGIVCIPIIYGYKPLVVLSGSMEPTFKVGSIIYYEEILENEIQVNDVITFSLGSETFITHRVIDIEDGLYQTKGDANNAPDVMKINFKNIHGRVTNTSIPLLGYYIEFVNNHLYILGFIIIILVSEFLLGSVKTFDIDEK